MSVTLADVRKTLVSLIDPNTGVSISSVVKDFQIQVSGTRIVLDVVLGYPANSQFQALTTLIREAFSTSGMPEVTVNISSRIVAHAVQPGVPLVPGVRNIIAVASGKGGVGKTTLACATALRLAEERPGKEVLLFSIDPAHSLAACLELPVGPHEVRVAAGLSAIELDAQAEYAVLKQEYASELKGVFKRESAQSGVGLAFDREVMERMLDVAPLGLDEVLAITRIVDLMDRRRYDTFVLDTAPTGHLLRFLEMPELIDQWLKTFFALFLKYRQLFWFERITQTMVTLSRRIKRLRRMLVDAQQAALVLVSIPTEMAYAESADLLAACARMGIAVPLQFINLVDRPSHCPVCALVRRSQEPVLEKMAATAAGRPVAQVFRQDEPRGVERLRALGRELYA